MNPHINPTQKWKKGSQKMRYFLLCYCDVGDSCFFSLEQLENSSTAVSVLQLCLHRQLTHRTVLREEATVTKWQGQAALHSKPAAARQPTGSREAPRRKSVHRRDAAAACPAAAWDMQVRLANKPVHRGSGSVKGEVREGEYSVNSIAYHV